MTVNEVAKLLGKSPLTMMKTREDRKNYTYVIYPELVKQYCGGQDNE